MEDLKFCRLCLVTEVKMYSLATTTIESFGSVYLYLTQISTIPTNQHVCFECASLLHKYHKFKSKCIRAQNTLYNIEIQKIKITNNVLQSYRKENYLESELILSVAKHMDMECNVNDYSIVSNINTQEIPNNLREVKEDKDCILDDITSSKDIINSIKDEQEVHDESSNYFNKGFSSDYNTLEENLSMTSLTSLLTSKSDNGKEKVMETVILCDNNEYTTINENMDQFRTFKTKNNPRNVRKQTKSKKRQIIKQDQEMLEETDLEQIESKTTISLFDKIKLSPQLLNTSVTKVDVNVMSCNKNIKKAKPRQPKRTVKKSGKEIDMSIFKDFGTLIELSKEDTRKELELRKESMNYRHSLFKCDLCYRGWDTKTTFDNHMKKHNAAQGDLMCDVCHFRFPCKIALWKHTKRHKMKFICHVCPYTCLGLERARSHVNLHKGKKYICDICGAVFRVQNSLCMHKHVKHKLSEYICEHCGLVFGLQRGLSIHKRIVHTQDKNTKLGPECAECKIHFSSHAAWNRHLVLSSKHKVSNGCKECGEMFPNMEELQSHMRIHTRISQRKDQPALPTACPICDKLTKRGKYVMHILREHPQSDEAKKLSQQRKHVCEICGQQFSTTATLRYHVNKHTGECPYKCNNCDEAFPSPNQLSIHKNTAHTGGYTYKCDTCGRMCRNKRTLTSHMKIHSGNRPYKCELCEKTFFFPCEVKTHVRHVHNNIPWPKKKKSDEVTLVV